MFDPPVATALFQFICKPCPGSSSALKTEEEVEALAAAFSAQRRQRASQVTPKQRQAMYTELVAQMDALPHIFVRQKDCRVVPLLPASLAED